MANRDDLMRLFELDYLLVMDGVYNKSQKGKAEASSFIGGKNALLTYRPARPGLRTPSAGYTFSWRGFIGAGGNGLRIKRFRMESIESDRVKAQQAYDFKVISKDLGLFIDDIVQ